MELVKDSKKIFVILFIIAIVIIIAIIWFPDKNIELSSYEPLSDDEININCAKLYGNELKYDFYSQDITALTEHISTDYLSYLGVSVNNFEEWLSNNELLSTNIYFGNTTKYAYGNINIWSIESIFNGSGKTVNIIELYPEKWIYTFDTFVFLNNSSIISKDDYKGVIINSIYQDLNYILFDCSIYVKDNDYSSIDTSGVDSIRLIMKDKTSFIMATNTVSSEISQIKGRKYANIKCIFNIPISSQTSISSINFNTFNINGESENIEINLSL